MVRVHLLFMDLSDSGASVEEVFSLSILGNMKSFVLTSPPQPTRYVPGVLSVNQRAQDISGDDEAGRRYYALRVDLPGPSERDSVGKRRGCMTLKRMDLSPVLDERSEDALFCHFNPFSGRALLLVNPRTSRDSALVVDYL